MNKKITELPSALDAEDSDLLLIIDVSSGIAKKISKSTLLHHLSDLYDSDGNLVVSAENGVLTSFASVDFSYTDILGSLTFASGSIQGIVTVDIQGNLIASGNMDVGGQGEIHGDAYFDGGLFAGFSGWQINVDGSAIFANGNAFIAADGVTNVESLSIAGGLALNFASLDFSGTSSVDTGTDPASAYPYSFVRGSDGKPYWSDGSAWHALY